MKNHKKNIVYFLSKKSKVFFYIQESEKRSDLYIFLSSRSKKE